MDRSTSTSLGSYDMMKESYETRESRMEITATDFKENFGRYLALARREDILVTKSGHPVVKLTGVRPQKVEDVESLFGLLCDLPAGDVKASKAERLATKYESLD